MRYLALPRDDAVDIDMRFRRRFCFWPRGEALEVSAIAM